MSPTIIGDARRALIARLETILPANGYRTDLGAAVRSGWFSEVIKSKEMPPRFCVLQRAPGLPPVVGPGAVKTFQGFTVIGAADAGFDGYEDDLEAMEVDLIQALMPPFQTLPKWLPRGITGITLSAVQHYPPGEGERHASVALTLHLHTLIQEKYR